MNDHIRVTSYNSVEEMLADQAEREASANAAVMDRQREIVWGSYAIRFYESGENETLLIFADLYDLETLVAAEESAGTDAEELEMFRARTEMLYQRGYRSGDYYSVIEPTGEFGDAHIATMWPISQDDFERARELGWHLPEKTERRIYAEMTLGMMAKAKADEKEQGS